MTLSASTRVRFFQKHCERSNPLLEQTIARDPQFALAYSSLAEAHLYMYRSMMTRRRGGSIGPKAADTALQFAPKLPQSHLAEVAILLLWIARLQDRALAELEHRADLWW